MFGVAHFNLKVVNLRITSKFCVASPFSFIILTSSKFFKRPADQKHGFIMLTKGF